MAKIPITQIPKLPMPDKFQKITIKIFSIFYIKSTLIYICEIVGNDTIYKFTPTEHMLRSISHELWVNDLPVDDEHIIGKVFDLFGEEAWFTRKIKNGEEFKPKVYRFCLRKDLENLLQF